jgi:glycosyltransferase involved in cell wall biosynthesis
MVPLEAQSYGRPVIAFGNGGSLETVSGTYELTDRQKSVDGNSLTGIFFKEQTVESLANAILAFESCEDIFVPANIQSHARTFDTSIFVNRLRKYIEYVMANGRRPLEGKAPWNGEGMGDID